ncbi:MAG TPA: hypothetical protein PKY88_12795 [Anaerohalosphaeraceae bacterium]|nr:hypothetical protein [Anaerohalosphaeraceae bacterium]
MGSARRRLLFITLESEKGVWTLPDIPVLAEDYEFTRATEHSPVAGGGKYIGPNNVGSLEPNLGICKFKVRFRSTGSSAAMSADLAALLQACGFKKTNEVYTFPTSSWSDQKTLSIASYEIIGGSALHKGLSGAMGTCKFVKTIPGQKLEVEFEFKGVWREVSKESIPVSWSPNSIAGMKASAFTIDSAAKKISSLEIDGGQSVVPEPDPNGTNEVASFIIADVSPKIKVDPETELPDSYNYDSLFESQTPAAIQAVFDDGTYKAVFAMPSAEIIQIENKDRDGIYAYDLTYSLNNSSGDDALTITMGAV